MPRTSPAPPRSFSITGVQPELRLVLGVSQTTVATKRREPARPCARIVSSVRFQANITLLFSDQVPSDRFRTAMSTRQGPGTGRLPRPGIKAH